MHLNDPVGGRPRRSGLRSELPSVLVAAAAVVLIVLVNAGTLKRPDAQPVPVHDDVRQAPAHEAVLRQSPPASNPSTAGKGVGI